MKRRGLEQGHPGVPEPNHPVLRSGGQHLAVVSRRKGCVRHLLKASGKRGVGVEGGGEGEGL